jgi:hypothetical protein
LTQRILTKRSIRKKEAPAIRLKAYEVFGNAAKEKAIKVILTNYQ